MARRDRQYSFDVFKDRTNTPSPNPLTPDFQYSDTVRTCAKRPLIDITEVVNNGIQPAKKLRRSFDIKSDKHSSPNITWATNNGI